MEVGGAERETSLDRSRIAPMTAFRRGIQQNGTTLMIAMKHPRRLNPKHLLAGILLGLVTASGCAESSKPPVRTAVTKQNVINETPALTPAQRSARFKAAFDRGMAFVAKKQYGLALGAFEEAVNANPTSMEAVFNLGACYEQIGDPFQAIQLYRRVLVASPDDPFCYANLGTSYIKMYHRERSPVWRKMAIEAWQRSLELNPDQPNLRQYVARAESPE